MGDRMENFETKNAARDEALPKVREQLLKVALNDLEQDPEVEGVYLAGSLAKANEDRYSDIDLHIIVAGNSLHRFIECKRDRCRRWGSVLFFEDDDPGLPVAVAHYESFVKVDAWYHSPDQLHPSLWLGGCLVLYDPGGSVQSVLDASDKLTYQLSAEEVELWRGKIFAYIHEAYRATMRGELFYAESMLDSFRWQMARGWYMELGLRVDSGKGVWSKMEGARSPLKDCQSSRLKSWYCPLDEGEIMRTLHTMVPEFLSLHRSLCHITGLQEDRAWCERVIKQVL